MEHIAIIIMLAVICAGVHFYRFTKLSREEQKANVSEWLLWAVTLAEKQYGGGMGKMKLREVYSMFVTAFPAIAAWLSFSTFSDMVDEALHTMRAMIENNDKAAAFVGGETKD